MSFVKKLSVAFFWNHLNKIVGYFLDFVLSVVLARGLGDYTFGIYSELFNFVFLFSLICSLGLDTAVNVYLPKNKNEPGAISYILRKTLLVVGVASVFLLFMLYSASPFLSRITHSPDIERLIKVAAIYILLHNFLILAQTILISFYITKSLLFINSLLKLSLIIFSWLLLAKGSGLEDIIKVFTVLSLVAGIAYFVRFYRLLLPPIQKIEIFKYFQFGFVTWLTKFVNYILGRYFDIFLMGYFTVPKNAIGYYNIAVTLTMALEYVFTSGFSGISLAACSEYEKRNELHQIARGWQLVTKFCIFFGIPAFAYAILHANSFIEILYSTTFRNTAILFQIFAFLYLMTIIIGSGMNVTILYALKKNKIVLSLRVFVGAINVFLDFILIPYYQAKGAIIATGCSTVLLVTLEHLVTRKFVNLSFPFKFFIKTLLSSFAALGFSLVFQVSGILTLFLNMATFIIVFLMINFILKPLSKDDKHYVQNIHPLIGRVAGYF